MIQIATYRGSFKEKFGVPRQAGVVPQLLGRIEFEKEWQTKDAIRGLEDFDYLWLIWGFSENKHEAKGVTVRPPRLGGNESLGVFATRSPYRPNPIGLSSVRIDHIEYNENYNENENCNLLKEATSKGPIIYVRGADLVDGTPIYDIKPYLPYTDAHADARGGFTDRVGWEPLEVDFSNQLLNRGVRPLDSEVSANINLEVLKAVLAQDPRPHYHEDPERIYGMRYGIWDVRFKVKNNKVIVCEIKK